MRKKINPRLQFIFLSLFLFPLACSQTPQTVTEVMDKLVTQLYQTMSPAELAKLNDPALLEIISAADQKILATRHLTFQTNVPVVVSVMRDQAQPVVPFWLTPKNGFTKTELRVKNEEYTYEVWQKKFDAGRIELGINGFDKHRPHYFVAVAPQNPADSLVLSQFNRANQFVGVLDVGAFTYHDWDELVLLEVPEALKGQQLLTTIRGRAREAHLLNAFRQTEFPATKSPDQIFLTWGADPQTTQSIQWRTNTEVPDGVVQFREKSAATDFVTTQARRSVLEDRLLQNDRYTHHFTARLENLTPATTYVYQVGSPAQNLWSDAAEFTTAPNRAEPFTFVYFGDTHCSPFWGNLLETAWARHPNTAFYTIAGDLVNTGLHRDDWDRFFAYSSEVIKFQPLMPTLGNHDDQDGLGAGMYFDLFDLPKNGPDNLEKERVYSFNYSNALFLVLDATSPIAAQVDWLEQQLAATNATWKFAMFHFPPFMYESDYPDIRKLWGAVFDKYHLDLAFSGHVHYYNRSKPMFAGNPVVSPAEGTVYVTSVAIPAGDEEIPEEKWAAVHFGGGGLYQKIDIDGRRLTYQVYDLAGNVRDELVIEK
jgi:hypothetical protein